MDEINDTMPHVWIYSVYAKRMNDDTEKEESFHDLGATTLMGIGLAQTMAYGVCLKRFPPDDGYYDHDVLLSPLPFIYIRAVFEYFTKMN